MFDVKKHLIKVQGGRQYLPVSARLVWFREEHPDWGIETKAIAIDTERQYAIFEATVYNETGRMMAKGTKMEDVRGFPDYVEKAETGAIGRALAVCGFGTQFAPDIDEIDGGRFVDTPQPVRGGQSSDSGYRFNGASSRSSALPSPSHAPAPRPQAARLSAPAASSDLSPARPEPRPVRESLSALSESTSTLAEDPFRADSPVKDGAHACTGCGREINSGQEALSVRKYGIGLCPQCQKERQAAEAAG